MQEAIGCDHEPERFRVRLLPACLGYRAVIVGLGFANGSERPEIVFPREQVGGALHGVLGERFENCPLGA